MTLRTFLVAVDALMAEEGVFFPIESGPGAVVEQQPTPADARARNTQSMEMLQGMLGGVKGAPGSKR